MLGALIALDNDFNRVYVFNYSRHVLYSQMRRSLGGLFTKWLFFVELGITKVLKTLMGAKTTLALVAGTKKVIVAVGGVKTLVVAKGWVVGKALFASFGAKVVWTVAALYGGV